MRRFFIQAKGCMYGLLREPNQGTFLLGSYLARRRFGSSSSRLAGSKGKKKKGSKASDPLGDIVNLCKRRGFIFQGSEAYGGGAAGYDYGPLGAQLKKNLADMWWKDFVERRPECMGIDTPVITSPKVWRASGHVDEFTDPLSQCSTCGHRARADKLIESAAAERSVALSPLDSMGYDDQGALLRSHEIRCPACGAPPGDKGLGTPRPFHLLFRTNLGPVEDASSEAFLRPETAQGAYVAFPQVAGIARRGLPLGIAQVGRSFRNEIDSNRFIFRTREFEQLELQYFVEPGESSKHLQSWVGRCTAWLRRRVGLSDDNVRLKEYAGEELAHYASATTDIEYRYPHGWDELWGIADRGDYDLRKHEEASGQSMGFRDPMDQKRVVRPHVVEPALGLNRLLLAVMCDADQEDVVPDGKGGEQSRKVLRLHPLVAPVQVAVLPLLKKDPGMQALARQIHAGLTDRCRADLDESGSIGRRYRRQDEVGTPLCVTVDHQSLEDGTVTVRCRDSTAQGRVAVGRLVGAELVGVPLRRSGFEDVLGKGRFEEVGPAWDEEGGE